MRAHVVIGILFTTALGTLAGSAPARALDLAATGFTCPAPGLLGYLPGSAITTTCTVPITTGGVLAKSAFAKITLESWSVSFVAGNFSLTKLDEQLVDSWFFDAGQTFERTVALNAAGALDTWLATQYSLGRKLRLAVTLDPLDTHVETNELNNTQAMSIITGGFYLTPILAGLRFGPASATITSGDVRRIGNLCCSAGPLQLATGATLSWAPGGNFPVQQQTLASDLNVTPYATSNIGLELTAAGSLAFAGIPGTFGGVAVSIDVTLNDRGITSTSLSATLPARHAIHEAGLLGNPLPRGASTVVFTKHGLKKAADLTSIVGQRSGGFLSIEGIPFYLSLSNLSLSKSGLGGSHLGPRYVHDLGFLEGDSRAAVLGIPRVVSNDIRFGRASLLKQPKPALRFAAQGLTATVVFGAAAGTATFPRMNLAWPTFTVQIQKGALKDRQTLPADLAQAFTQSPDCPACPGTAPGTVYAFKPSGAMGLGSDGAVLASVTGLPSPSWGPVADAGGHIFTRSGENGPSGKLLIPGFVMRGTGLAAPASPPPLPVDPGAGQPPTTVGLSVAESLLGSRSARLESGVLKPAIQYGLTDDEARRGNHFAAGLTVGPERYSEPGTGAPVVGVGQDLTGSSTTIRFGGPHADGGCGGAPCAVVGNLGTRYVVRPAGITGAFNTSLAPSPTVYDYPIPFDKFGWRQVLNEVDPYTWNAGAIEVEAPGGFETEFTSLGLTCTGALTEALVIPCDPAQGPNAPNCGEDLDAWHAPFSPLTLRFVPEADSSLCDPGERELEIGASVGLAALDEALGLTAIWEPDGEPRDARVTGRSDNVLERPRAPATPSEDHGFPVALHDTVVLEHLGDTRGWFVFNMDFGISFFDAINADVRVENTTIDTAAPTLVRAGNGTGQPDLAIDWGDEPACDRDNVGDCAPRAHYTWGVTGIDIDLPAFFDVDPAGTRAPRFSGITENHSFVVMDVEAGVDYATAESAHVSFGASADFENLSLSLFQAIAIDVSDALSIPAFDEVLVGLGVPKVNGQGPIGAIAEGVRAKADVLLDVVGDATETELRAVLTDQLALAFEAATPGMSVDLVTDLATLRAFPATITSEVTVALGEMLADAIEPFTTALHEETQELVTLLESILEKTEVAPCQFLGTACNDALTTLGAVVDAVEKARNTLATVADVNAIANAIDDAIDRIDAVVAETQGTLTAAISLAADIRLDVLGGAAIAGIETPSVAVNPLYAFLIATLVPGVSDVLDELEGIDFVDNVGRLASLIPIPATAAEVQSDIVGRARELLDEVELVVPSFELALGDLDLSKAVDGAEDFISDIEDLLVTMDLGTTTTTVSAELDIMEVDVSEIIDYLDKILALLAELQQAVQCAQDPACVGTVWTGLTPTQLKAKLNDEMKAATGGLIPTFCDDGTLSTFVLELPVVIRVPVDEALAAIAAAVETLVPEVLALPPLTTAADLEATLVDLIAGSGALELVLTEVSAHFDLLVEDVTLLVDDLFAQVEALIADLAVAINDAAASALAGAQSVIDAITPDLPIDAASIDGYALIAGDELERLHVDADFTMNGTQGDDTRTFSAALDVTSWATNGKGDACDPAADATSLVDAVISTENLPLTLGTGEVTIETAELGFTLQGDGSGPPAVVGLFGGITTDGALSFNEFEIYDIGFQAGAGLYETYLGASASASFSSMFLSVAFLVGKTCGDDVLVDLDPQAAEFITLPNDVFNGVYARGSAAFPVVDFGCLLNLSLSADVGTWLIGGPPLTLGGLVGGGAFGKLGCIGALRGQATAFAELSGDTVKFLGEGFAAAGVGLDCDPETWTSVSASRADKSCGTGDASLSITFERGVWDASKPNVSAVH